MPKRSFPVRTAILSTVVFAAAAVILPTVWFFTRNLVAACSGAAAAIICWLAALLAMMAGDRLGAAGQTMAYLVAGTMIRAGIPLMATVVVVFFGRPLDAVSFLYYLIVFYPITLAAEIAITLPRRVGDSDSAT
jgi:hypothetical protein